jgi:hypothetical protein
MRWSHLLLSQNRIQVPVAAARHFRTFCKKKVRIVREKHNATFKSQPHIQKQKTFIRANPTEGTMEGLFEVGNGIEPQVELETNPHEWQMTTSSPDFTAADVQSNSRRARGGVSLSGILCYLQSRFSHSLPRSSHSR